ncbi:DNA/RNA-binding protein Alba-like [Trypanosoma melophagium]|uniref:DNA/RNA-binding protein Alba-like n=1 Tax=Trypanosoma melophagium TaxID=715481 RepID=UPI00351A3DF1|nr:DNA/RNA-binding protein Alba-like [Trypanosoma melophagium]
MPTYPSRDEYRRVRKAEGEKEKGQGPENEIRVTAKHGQRSYIAYAIALLRGEDGKAQYDTVKISAMGAAIHNAVNIAEIVKRRVAGLHQTTDISSEVIRDEYEPVDEKKERLEVERKVSTILITLSLKPLDKHHVGYQPPLPEDEVKEQEEREPGESTAGGLGRRPRNAARGGGSRGSGGAGRGSSRGGGNYGGARGSGRGRSRGGASRGGA